ncbi:MAG: protein phosphatase 2C domain-containing protein, partial [Candidatus Hadarchaeum sp.]
MLEEKGQLEELEELFEPEESVLPRLLSDGSVVQTHEGKKYRIKKVLSLQRWRPPYNIYEIIEVGEPKPSGGTSEEGESEAGFQQGLDVSVNSLASSEQPEVDVSSVFWLWEAVTPEAISSLRHEAEILLQVNSPMFPKVYTQFQQNGNLYLVTDVLPEKTLTEAIEQKELTFSQFLSVLAQVAHALIHLHEKGWVHLGVRPQAILIDKPIKLVDFRWAIRIGEKPSSPFFHSGFSPPELIQSEQPVDEKYDIFSVGALLYLFVSGQPLPETGFQTLDWQCSYSGVPQVLHRCLGAKEERYPNMQVLHRELLRLKRYYTPLVTYKVVGATTIGLEPSRTTNQDAYGYLEINTKSEGSTVRCLVTCVADGMGGMEAGEIASEIAVKTVLSEAAYALSANVPLSSDEQVRMVKEWVHKANEKVCAAMGQRRAKGGTTLLCCFLVGERMSIAHVGDCRLYLVRNGNAILLTRDHSLAMALALQEGKVDPDALRHHPDRSRLTRSLGDCSPLPHYFVDSLEVTAGKPVMELQEGDILLLCSDGLWEPVSESEIVSILEEHR